MTCSVYDGKYEITDDGRLFSVRSKKWLKPSTDKYGYLCYVISIDSKRYTIKAHRMVAICFIPNPDDKPTVDHINGDRKDNRVANLRWATYKEQQQNPITVKKAQRIHSKTDYRSMGEKRNFGRKKTEVFRNGIQIGTYDSLREATNALSVNYSKASECANGNRKSTGGYVFCYV